MLRTLTICLRFGLVGMLFGASALQAYAQPGALTLDQAMRLAETNNPAMRSAQTQLGASEAEHEEARSLLWNNPQLNVEARRRSLSQAGAGSVNRSDPGIGLSQTFEIGGQPRARRDATQNALEATRQTIEQTRRDVRQEAAKRFLAVLALQSRIAIEQAGADLVRQASDIVAKRVKAGEDTRLDGNLALVEAERATNQLAQSRDELFQARASLATTLQLPPTSLPEAVGGVPAADAPYTLDEMLATVDQQPRVRATDARERAAASRLELERAARYPDVTVGLTHSRERSVEGTDRITTLSVSVPLPLFRHNDAAIARASTELEQSRIDLQALRRDSEASVRVLWQRLEQTRQRSKRLETAVVPALLENQRLSLAALREGEINVTQFLLARRQALDAQRELADAQAQAALARLELEAAAGRPASLSAPMPATTPRTTP